MGQKSLFNVHNCYFECKLHCHVTFVNVAICNIVMLQFKCCTSIATLLADAELMMFGVLAQYLSSMVFHYETISTSTGPFRTSHLNGCRSSTISTFGAALFSDIKISGKTLFWLIEVP